MHGREEIQIVALDMNTTGDSSENYVNLSETKKIALICERIEKICQNLDPNAKWIIAWREYGLRYENSILSANYTKKLMKQKFSALTWKYPNLMIVAGTIAHTKSFPMSHAKQLLEYYNMHPKLYDDVSFIMHKKPIEKLQESKIIDKLKNIFQGIEKFLESKKPTIEILRNTCYIFQSTDIYVMRGLPFVCDLEKYNNSYIFTKHPLALTYINKNHEIIPLKVEKKELLKNLLQQIDMNSYLPLHILLKENKKLFDLFTRIIVKKGVKQPHINRIDKTAPFKETAGMDQKNTFFKIGGKKSRNMEHLFNQVGIEICREHDLGTLKRELKNSNISKPLIHLILSSSIIAKTDFISGDYLAHFDPWYRPILFTTKNHDGTKVTMFSHDMTQDDEKNLLKPIEPIYPFRYYFVSELKMMLNESKNDRTTSLFSSCIKIEDEYRSNALLSARNSEGYHHYYSLLKDMRTKLKEDICFSEKLKNMSRELKKQYKKELALNLSPQFSKKQRNPSPPIATSLNKKFG